MSDGFSVNKYPETFLTDAVRYLCILILMDITLDFPSAQQNISAALVSTTRVASQISAEDVTFHRSSSANIARLLERQNTRLLALAERLLRNAAASFGTSLVDLESIDGSWSSIVDTLDNLLERSDICLDEYNGRFKDQPVEQQSDSSAHRMRPVKLSNTFNTQNLLKPQLSFEHPPNNHESQPFRPLLSFKPHALIPLERAVSVRENEHGVMQYQHPYQSEIEQYQYPPFLYTDAEPLSYQSFEDTQATFVDDYNGVLSMLEELKNATEIAIDLEHHDTHSYVGLVSLMQISTRDHDWIIDTLKPWRRKLEVLNEVFADPKILKVLHGAHMDIVWLQRDLGLYIVGLFDTHHASRVLDYSGGSLAFLLKKFVNFDAQKQYQLADWRMRPLPMEMFDYARSDTHFLLYIYDNIRNDLIRRSKFDLNGEDRVRDVLERSKETALQRFEHFIYDEDRGSGRGGWFSLLLRNTVNMSREQFFVFRKVHQWRDTAARQEDENVGQIMPGHVLFNIARSLPQDVSSLLAVSHPISQSMRLHSSELVDIIRKSLTDSKYEPEMQDKVNDLLQLQPGLARKPTTTTTAAHQAASQTLIGLSQKDSISNSDTIAAANNDIRSNSSAFWGTTLNSREQCPNKSFFGNYSAHIGPSFPRYQLAVHDFASVDRQGLATSAPPSSSTLGGIKDDSSLSASRTIGGSNGKRKADEVINNIHEENQEMPSSQDRISLVEPTNGATFTDDVTMAERRAAKQARKASRERARELESINEASGGISAGSGVAQPFEYSSAPSILHRAKVSHAPTGENKAFNPYAKAGEAASGLKKAQEFRSGKSYTFKH